MLALWLSSYLLMPSGTAAAQMSFLARLSHPDNQLSSPAKPEPAKPDSAASITIPAATPLLMKLNSPLFPQLIPRPPLRPRLMPYPRTQYIGPWMGEHSGRHAAIGAAVGFGLGLVIGSKGNTSAGRTLGVGVIGAGLGAAFGLAIPSFPTRNPYRRSWHDPDEDASRFKSPAPPVSATASSADEPVHAAVTVPIFRPTETL
jgi:hypothetical protein